MYLGRIRRNSSILIEEKERKNSRRNVLNTSKTLHVIILQSFTEEKRINSLKNSYIEDTIIY